MDGRRDRSGRALIIGAGLTLLWLLMLLVFWLTADPAAPGGRGWVSVVAALMPLALIWIAVRLAMEIDALKAEAAELRAAARGARRASAPRPEQDPMAPQPSADRFEAARARAPAGPQGAAAPIRPPAATAAAAGHQAAGAGVVRSGGGVPGQGMAGPGIAGRGSAGVTAARPDSPAGDPRQPSLGLAAPEPLHLPIETLIRALDFPDGPDDLDAIEAMREALGDPDTARVIRSAQDVVTLLAGRGIYTDEMDPAPVVPGAWRRFADGERGLAVADAGAVRDPDMLDQAASIMRADDVFRDAAHHFLRLFDRLLARRVPELDDETLTWLANTRSARAFMLLARAAGLFGQHD